MERFFHKAAGERKAGFETFLSFSKGKQVARLDTKISRDPSRSNNGGEYFFWAKVWYQKGTGVFVQERCSCDFWQPENEPKLIAPSWATAKRVLRRLAREHGIPCYRPARAADLASLSKRAA